MASIPGYENPTLKCRWRRRFRLLYPRDAESGRAAPSLRILQQCLDNMPEALPFKADHLPTTPPPERAHALQHETPLITHLPQVSPGPGDAGAGVLPDGGSDEGD